MRARKPLFDQSREQFHQFLAVQASIRGLPAIVLLDKDLNVVDEVETKVTQAFVKPSAEVLAGINDTEPQVAMFLDANHVASIIKLRGYNDVYLYIARLLDPRVLAQLRGTQASVAQYADLSARRIGIQIAFALMYTVIALIVLLSAVWIGLNFANYLVAPIRRLIGAAQVVSTGNLYVQVPTRRSGRRSCATRRDLQQDDPGAAHATRRHRARARPDRQPPPFHRGRAGRSKRRRHRRGRREPYQHPEPVSRATDRRVRKLRRSDGRSTDIVPELADIFAAARSGLQRLVQGQVTINRNGRERNLSVRVTSEQSSAAEGGYVVTLDDITELVSRAAHLRLGRRRAPYRTRDQEPAHADPALRRTAAAQVCQRDQG